MKTLNKTIAFATLAASLIVGGTAMAQNYKPMVPVDPGPVEGPACVMGSVYGYKLQICSSQYRVDGQGLSCTGYLNHSGGNFAKVKLHRGNCNSGTDWSADTIRCDGAGQGGSPAGKLKGAQCTYFPNAAGRAEGFNSTGVYFN